MKKALALSSGLIAAVLVTGSAAASGPLPRVELGPANLITIDDGITKSNNVRLRAHFPFKNGTDIDFANGFVYASEQGDNGGVHIIDVTGHDPKRVGFVRCPGFQDDVAVVKPGLIAIGFIEGECGRGLGGGMRLVDVRDPKRPVYLGGVGIPNGAHTLTTFPGEDLVYLSPGGFGENGGEQFVVDVSKPRRPKIVHRFTPNPLGCHDVSFHVGRDLGFCPGQLGTEIWDVTNPAKPKAIGHVPPAMEFAHSAIASPDGKLLVVSDESYVAHDCRTQRSPLGALSAWDISDPSRPIFKGSISSPRGESPIGNLAIGICGAHNFNFVENSRKVVSSWYTGGTSVIDFADPTAPKEIAYYRADDSDTWSSYFYRGYVIVNDQNRGLELMTVDDLPQPSPPPPPPSDPEDPKDPKEPKPPEPKCRLLTDDEKAFARKVNDARRRHDVRKLSLDHELSLVAQAHSSNMRREQKLRHSNEKWLRERVTRWEILGENVGRGHSIHTLHRSFMESEPHRKNVTYKEFRYVGVGIAEDGDQIWITVLFEAYDDPGTTMEMP
ncbi:MAG: hypothetical protein KY391_04755, partial [Actinobacteria bacterium]|nr:hypothetical protein [Actinomycetota bacterium]